jgi:hypothetical protein
MIVVTDETISLSALGGLVVVSGSVIAAAHPDSFGSGHSVWQRRVTTLLSLKSRGAEYAPETQLLG